MTNKNITIDSPFLLEPVGKDYLWGGEKLKREFNKTHIQASPLAETWECSTHPAGLSTLRSGVFSGKSLFDFLHENPELLCNPEHRREFPVLLKLIDAKNSLSLQVHPSDDYAAKYEDGQKGKTEFWFILDAEPDSFIYFGFKSSCSKASIRKLIANGELESVLNKVFVKKGDSFLVHPGIVHAIGKGIVLAEVQENSNLTYRLYDYGRKDVNGNLRELHIEKALNVIDLNCNCSTSRRIKNIRYEKGVRKERLVGCEYFVAESWSFKEKGRLPRTNKKNSIVLCVDGDGRVERENEEKIFTLKKGDCFFMPKSENYFYLTGNCQIIVVEF